MIDVNMKVDPMSEVRFMREMHRRAAILARGQKGIVEIAAVKLVTSLRAGTAQSPKRRVVLENPEYWQARADLVAKGERWKKTGRTVKKSGVWPWAARMDYRVGLKNSIPLSGGGSLMPLIGAKKKGDANRHYLAQITRQGLARRSWTWMLKGVSKLSDIKMGDPMPTSVASGKTTMKTQGPETIAEWVGVNRLHYMRAALKRSIGSSIHAASTLLSKETEREIAKLTHDAGY
ncbi:MAG: hypothetical protein PHH26_01670 [Candidatus Thermoplasmatota archaeon]|nr:hypothetical protein [Candidatus Thermoplasmatota archaeon]